MQDRYFVEMSDGQRYGPADLPTLKEWAAQGRVEPFTMLVPEGTDDRVRADSLEGLFEKSDTQLPPPVISGPPPAAPSPAYPPAPAPYAPTTPSKTTSPLLIVAIVLGGLGLCLVPFLAAILFPVFSQAKQAARRTHALSGMKQLATGVLLYGSDFDDRFPPAMQSATTFRPAIEPYVKNPELFKSSNPKGGEILGDKRLNGRLMENVVDPMQTIMLYDSLPWERGDAPIARIDGSAKFLPPARITSLMVSDPFGGLTAAQERRREAAAAP